MHIDALFAAPASLVAAYLATTLILWLLYGGGAAWLTASLLNEIPAAAGAGAPHWRELLGSPWSAFWLLKIGVYWFQLRRMQAVLQNGAEQPFNPDAWILLVLMTTLSALVWGRLHAYYAGATLAIGDGWRERLRQLRALLLFVLLTAMTIGSAAVIGGLRHEQQLRQDQYQRSLQQQSERRGAALALVRDRFKLKTEELRMASVRGLALCRATAKAERPACMAALGKARTALSTLEKADGKSLDTTLVGAQLNVAVDALNEAGRLLNVAPLAPLKAEQMRSAGPPESTVERAPIDFARAWAATLSMANLRTDWMLSMFLMVEILVALASLMVYRHLARLSHPAAP